MLSFDPQAAIDIAIGVVTLLGSVAGGIGAAWMLFRRKLSAWWAPYKAGIQGSAQVPAMAKEMEVLAGQVHLLTLHVRARGDIDISTAQFETDATGQNIEVNLTYARWLGVGKGELLRWGWINFVHPDDRIRVRKEWDSCRTEHRTYSIRFRMLDVGGEVFTVDVLATHIPEDPPAKKWLGVMRRVVNDGEE